MRASYYVARKEQMKDFLERDDNSHVHPNKSNVMKKKDGTYIPKRTLNDTANLYAKLCSENPDMNMRLGTFCRMRPTHLIYVKLTV